MNNIINWKIIDAFSYLYQLLNNIIKNESLFLNDIRMWGGRESAKTLSVLIFCLKCLVLDLDVTILCILNKTANIKKTLWSDILNLLEPYMPQLKSLKINETHKTITNKKAILEVRGLHKQTKQEITMKGNYQVKTKYFIGFTEEGWEISKHDRDALYNSIRFLYPLKAKGKLWIDACNPDSILNYWINQLEQKLPADEHLLKKQGYQIKKEGKILYHRVNWRINPYKNGKLAEDEDLQKRLANLWVTDPNRAKVWDLGMAGKSTEGIFTHLLKYMLVENKERLFEWVNQQEALLFAGLDFGYKKDAFACTLIATQKHNKEDYVVLDEFVLYNHKTAYSHQYIAEQLINWLNNYWQYYTNKYKLMQDYLEIKCDFADYAFMSICNQTAISKNMMFLRFEKAIKYNLQISYNFLQQLISSNRLGLSNNCTNLLLELEVAKWKESGTQLENNPDHALDALRYALHPYLNENNKMRMF